MSVVKPAGALVLLAVLATSAVFADDEPASVAGNATSGRIVFEQLCGICHAVSPDGSGPTMGPNLFGVVGRPAASEPNYAMYSAALRGYGKPWSAQALDGFLRNPLAAVPGTTMPVMLPKDQERADVIAYLASLE